MSPVRPEDYDEIVARVNRKYEGSLKRGDEFDHPNRISTGSLELDMAMGGGVPMGRFSRFYGGPSSTKTLTTYETIRNAQQMGLTCAYYNIEKQYDPKFVGERGVDASALTIVDGTTIEQVGEQMEALLGVVHLHVLDSCTYAVSEDELNADLRDWRPGIQARAWGKVFRRLNERFDHYENTVILIDQVRTNFRTGGDEAPGGRILDHQSSMTVYFKKGSWLFRNGDGDLDEKAKQEKGMSGQIEPSGIEIKARVEKSRVGRPLLTATRRFDMDTKTFDTLFELTKAAKHYGVVEQRGSYFYYEGAKIGQGEKSLRDFVRADLTLQDQIRETALDAARR